MDHYVVKCQFGETHAQCRCPSNTKRVRLIQCTTPTLHDPNLVYVPKHRMED